jgi:hypothetical protein
MNSHDVHGPRNGCDNPDATCDAVSSSGWAWGGAAAISLDAAFWNDLFSAVAGRRLRRGSGYGPLRPLDENGIRLPARSRARSSR